MSRRLIPLAVIAWQVVGGPALAERSAGGSLHMSTRGAVELDPSGDRRLVAGTGNVDLRALYGERLAAAVAFGFEIGGEIPAGFGYAVRLSPIGGALRFGQRGWIGAVAGVGGSGVIDRVPIALELPVTAFVGFDLGSRIRFSSRLRGAWTPTSTAREDGSRAVSWVDELDLEAGLAIGERESRYRSVYSDGTYAGVFVREQQGRRVVGVSIAIAISGAGRF